MKHLNWQALIYPVVIIVGLAVGWGVIKTTVMSQEIRLNKLEDKVNPMPERLAVIETKLDMILRIVKK